MEKIGLKNFAISCVVVFFITYAITALCEGHFDINNWRETTRVLTAAIDAFYVSTYLIFWFAYFIIRN